jgi:hypothetical protein
VETLYTAKSKALVISVGRTPSKTRPARRRQCGVRGRPVFGSPSRRRSMWPDKIDGSFMVASRRRCGMVELFGHGRPFRIDDRECMSNVKTLSA